RAMSCTRALARLPCVRERPKFFGRSRHPQEVRMGEVLSQIRFSVHRVITEKIVAMIDAGTGTYTAPWHGPAVGGLVFPVNASTHALYRGVNVLSLWVDAGVKGYVSGFWASYHQWQSLGAQVRKGEQGSIIVFYKRIEARPFEAEDDDRK